MKKEQLVKSNKTYYCRLCGSQMLEDLIGAENYFEEYPECGRSYPYREFNRDTGKRQYIYKYTCPNSRWFNRHDDFFVDKIITFGALFL